MLGTYTGLSILTTSHLSFAAVQKRFTPKLPHMLPRLVDELNYALPHIIGPCKDWTPIDLNDVMTRVVSHLTAATWVGGDLARNEEWHKANAETTANIFTLAIALKVLPAFLQPLAAPVLPMKKKLDGGLERVHAFLVPLIEERKRLVERNEKEKEKEKPEDMIQWMLDAAESEQERDTVNLATRYVYAVIGSLFTVSAALVDCVYDLVAYPEHIAPLREEVERVLKEDGGWQKGTPAKLELMDSFMKESQRVNPPSPSKSAKTIFSSLPPKIPTKRQTPPCNHLADRYSPSRISQLQACRQGINDPLGWPGPPQGRLHCRRQLGLHWAGNGAIQRVSLRNKSDRAKFFKE